MTLNGGTAPTGDTVMSTIGWIILGLVAGFIASKLVNHGSEGILLHIVLGVVGAIVAVGCFRSPVLPA
jgi:uncharacterized membrane protein YeaQ/YmgE (transglycosylase-associated protein family)